MPFNASMRGSFSSIGRFNRRKIVVTPGTVVFNYTGAAQYFTVPEGTEKITVKMWGAAGGEYNAGHNLNNGGGTGGYTETTFNVIESTLTIIVGGGGAYGSNVGFGGGGGQANGGSSGGGCSAIFSGTIINPFTWSTDGHASNIPSSQVQGLSGASQVIAVAGGGGGAGWYNVNNMYGGGGGGLLGSNNSGGYVATTGGTQSSSNNGENSTGAGRFSGGYIVTIRNGGGSGGGGGGWYGGGAAQSPIPNDSKNTSGAGGSGFIGYQNGSTSSVLLPNQPNGRDYIDSIARVNGSRVYENSKCLSVAAGTFTPPNTSDSNWSSPIAVPRYYPGNDGTGQVAGHGRVVISYF